MVTVALAVPEPPAPLHSSVNVVAALIGPVVSDPDGDLTPLQPSDAWQVSASVLDQVSVDVPPTTTFVGSAWSCTVGAGGGPLPPPPPPPPQPATSVATPARRIFRGSMCGIVRVAGMSDFSLRGG
ncbi:MAG TPA: hypothetical protein VFC01_22445, partial [Mycobacterium sp.]|nr:hypothetical protein [Mycobacterium sp.]